MEEVTLKMPLWAKRFLEDQGAFAKWQANIIKELDDIKTKSDNEFALNFKTTLVKELQANLDSYIMSEFLIDSFSWSNTDEKLQFWSNITQEARQIENTKTFKKY